MPLSRNAMGTLFVGGALTLTLGALAYPSMLGCQPGCDRTGQNHRPDAVGPADRAGPRLRGQGAGGGLWEYPVGQIAREGHPPEVITPGSIWSPGTRRWTTPCRGSPRAQRHHPNVASPNSRSVHHQMSRAGDAVRRDFANILRITHGSIFNTSPRSGPPPRTHWSGPRRQANVTVLDHITVMEKTGSSIRHRPLQQTSPPKLPDSDLTPPAPSPAPRPSSSPAGQPDDDAARDPRRQREGRHPAGVSDPDTTPPWLASRARPSCRGPAVRPLQRALVSRTSRPGVGRAVADRFGDAAPAVGARRSRRTPAGGCRPPRSASSPSSRACGAGAGPCGTAPASSPPPRPAPRPTRAEALAAAAATRRPRRSRTTGRCVVHGSGTRQPSRPLRACPVLLPDRVLEHLDGQVGDLGQPQLLALVEVRRTGQRQHQQRRGAGPAQARRAVGGGCAAVGQQPGVGVGARRAARAGRRAGPRRGWRAPRSPRRPPPARSRSESVMTWRSSAASQRGLQVLEVERLAQFVRRGRTARRRGSVHPGLGDGRSAAGS